MKILTFEVYELENLENNLNQVLADNQNYELLYIQLLNKTYYDDFYLQVITLKEV